MGHSELFQKLWIGTGQDKYEWKQHPVISLDLKVNNPHLADVNTFKNDLLLQLRNCAQENEVKAKGDGPPRVLESLIDALQAKFEKNVVLLIDNYDSPLIADYPKIDFWKKNSIILSKCFTLLRALKACLRFVLITGEFRFPDRFLYTPIPRPFDLSYNREFASLCGITTKEMDRYCYEHMEAATDQLKAKNVFSKSRTVLDFRRALLYNYNGYSFDGETRVINPHTLMHTLKYQTFGDSAYNLEKPSKQIELINKNKMTFDLFNSHHFVTRLDNAVSISSRPILPYLLHTGYLTIRRIRPVEDSTNLLLRIPTHEIRRELFLHLLANGRKKETMDILRKRMAMVYRSLQSRSVSAIETSFRVLAASIHKPMYISEQDYFNKDLYLAMRMLFQAMDLDDPREDGVIDGAIDFPGGDIFIIQLRSADREWINVEHEPFQDGNFHTISWPWNLPAQPRRLESEEMKEPYWVELNTFLDLEAQKAIEVIDEKKYPARFFPYINWPTKIYKVGVAIYQRHKVRAIVEEAYREPLKVPVRRFLY
jgi:hypothetical protein